MTGRELLAIWEAGKDRGLTQRRLASYIGEGFNSVHGKIFREQKKSETREGSTLKLEYEPVTFKAAVFDIETTDFSAGGINDHLVCVSILPVDSEVVTTYRMMFEDNRDDRSLLVDAMKALEEFDILIGHNIAAFDINWLNSRILYHNLPQPEKRWMYYDTYQAARRQAIKANRKSLGFLADFFRLPGEKTAVLPVSWSMVDSPNKDEFEHAMDDIVYHCEQDVFLNRNLFFALWPRDKSNLNLPFVKRW